MFYKNRYILLFSRSINSIRCLTAIFSPHASITPRCNARFCRRKECCSTNGTSVFSAEIVKWRASECARGDAFFVYSHASYKFLERNTRFRLAHLLNEKSYFSSLAHSAVMTNEEAISEADKFKIASNLIQEAPPGEFSEVWNDVRILVNDDNLMTQCMPAAAQYHKDQMLSIKYDNDSPRVRADFLLSILHLFDL